MARVKVGALLLCAMSAMLATAVLGTTEVGNTKTHQLSCSAVLSALEMIVPESTGIRWQRAYNELECSHTSLMKHVLNEIHHVKTNGSTIVLEVTDTDLAELVAFGVAGRLCTKSSAKDRVFLEYDQASDTVKLRKPRCEFQKSMYSAMLIILVLAVIGLVLSMPAKTQARREAANEQPQQTKTDAAFGTNTLSQVLSTGAVYSPAQSANNYMLGGDNRFRYRPIRQ